MTRNTKIIVETFPLDNNNNADSVSSASAIKDPSNIEEHSGQFKEKKISYQHIGGLDKQIQIVKEMVETTLKNPELFMQYGNSLIDQ